MITRKFYRYSFRNSRHTSRQTYILKVYDLHIGLYLPTKCNLIKFQRKNESSKTSRIPKFNKSLTSSLENINKKPIIVDEIPKPQLMKYVDTDETVTVLNDSSIQYKKTAKEFELTEEESEKLRPVIIHEIKMQHSVEENLGVNEVSNTDAEYTEVNNKNNDNTNKMRRYKSLSNMENELERQRKKSLAEIDLGDSIKGRVGNMIQRMISIEAKNNPSSGIKKYEMPKKQTVAERIAQFEVCKQIDNINLTSLKF